MATIKSYTTIEQSRKLAEILSLESADMEYLAIKENGKLVGSIPFVKDDSEVEDSAYSHTYDRIACWSLAALLDVLPEINGANLKFERVKAKDGYDGYYYYIEYEGIILIPYSKNPIDACYEIILKLHELKML